MQGAISYSDIKAISWDHANSEVKFELVVDVTDETYVIFTMANTIELEGEVTLRSIHTIHTTHTIHTRH